jgi:hypothetical protein
VSAHDSAYQRRQWLIKAPLSLVIIGFGVSLVSEAAMLKYGGGATLNWVLYGTIALIVLNAGLCVLVDAGKHRAHYERLRDNTPEA